MSEPRECTRPIGERSWRRSMWKARNRWIDDAISGQNGRRVTGQSRRRLFDTSTLCQKATASTTSETRTEASVAVASRQDGRQSNSFSSSARNGSTLTWKCSVSYRCRQCSAYDHRAAFLQPALWPRRGRSEDGRRVCPWLALMQGQP